MFSNIETDVFCGSGIEKIAEQMYNFYIMEKYVYLQKSTVMRTMYYEMMEKYSSYKRAEPESNGQSIYDQWAELKKKLVKDCDIDRTGYHLDLADEKRIGKAKVANPVVTPADAFAHLQHLKPCKENAFLFRKR